MQADAYPENVSTRIRAYVTALGVSIIIKQFHRVDAIIWIRVPVANRGECMREVCGNCKYNKRDFSKPQNQGYAEFCCNNEDSDCYGVPTMWDDACDDFEEKD